MAKCKIYAIAYGVDPNTAEIVLNLKVRTWDECKTYIDGVKGARYKGFLTDEEADAWLESVQRNKNTTPNSKKSTNNFDDVDDLNNEKFNDKYDIHFEFGELCKELNLSSSDVLLQLKKQFVDFHKNIKPLK